MIALKCNIKYILINTSEPLHQQKQFDRSVKLS